jgi:IS1 family transposase/DNA-directed RNA polymerase subunit RPC12/RpoP
MLTKTLSCSHCGSERLVRDGFAPNGKQKYRCYACGRRGRENPTSNAYSLARREEILSASSGTQQPAWPHPHVWSLSHNGHNLDQKKVAQLPPLSTTLLAPDPEDTASTILELDERMAHSSFKKPTRSGSGLLCAVKHDRWLLMHWGIEAGKTCLRLWQSIPLLYRKGHCFTDFWVTDQAVIPEAQHTAVGKETGETAHVERWNNTLRQRLARFVRMTLSFSKSVIMHEACLLLSLHRYNKDQVILLT